MTEIINFIKALTPHDWATILGVFGGGATVAVVLQAVKHFLLLKDAKKVVMFLLAVFSFAASFADWFLQYHSQNPKVVVGTHFGWIVTAAIFIHRFAVSPLYYKLTGFLNGIYKDAKAYRAEVAPNLTTPMDVVAAAIASPTQGAPINDFTAG